MQHPNNAIPRGSTHRQSSELSTEHSTQNQTPEHLLYRFCILQKEQFGFLQELLGQRTPIPISPRELRVWERGIPIPNPCSPYRSQPRHRKVFGFDDDEPLKPEKDMKVEKYPFRPKTWIELDRPSPDRQKKLMDQFIECLSEDPDTHLVRWPQTEVQQTDSSDSSRKTVYKTRGEIAGYLEIEWNNPVGRGVDLGFSVCGVPCTYDEFVITDPFAHWNVISTGHDYVQFLKGRIPYRIYDDFSMIITGRYIECYLRGIVTFRQVALFCCIFSNFIEVDSDMAALTQLLQAYTSAWEPERKVIVVSNQVLFQQFHFRYPEVCDDDENDECNPQAAERWIPCSREKGKMPKNPERDIQRVVIERRVSILFATKSMGPARPWKIVTLADKRSHNLPTPSISMEQLLQRQADKQPSERFFVLLNALRKELEVCSRFWEWTLDQLEKDFRINIDKVTEGDTLKTWMFDGESNERSKLYFKRLSMLQIFSDWVEDTLRDLSNTAKTIPSEYTGSHGLTVEEIEGIEVGVHDFQEEIEDALGPITYRINQTREEIVIFRDGMFNSTSIREAHEVTRQGRYVLLFTIMTVVYLPLAFVTGFFGMNNLENVNGSLLTSWTPFITVFIVVTIFTYVTAWLAISWVHRHDITLRWDLLKKDGVQRHGGRNDGRTTETLAERTMPMRWLRRRLCCADKRTDVESRDGQQ